MDTRRGFSILFAVVLAGTVAVSSSQAAYQLLDTGQDNCWDDQGDVVNPAPGEDWYGQDAQFTGLQMGYTDNGDGTVTDLNTGLIWQQSPVDQPFNWAEAVSYCDDLVLGGYDDWRMPTLKELFSISDFSVGWPYLDSEYFDIAGSELTKDEQFWADNYYVGLTHGGMASAFGVNHATGHIKAYPAEAPGPMGNYVRAVRGNVYGENDFADNGDGTVTDQATGMMWQQDDSFTGMNWKDALAYAEDLEVGGYTDWRLPNIKELQSIVDYRYSPTATDPVYVGPAINLDYFNITELPADSTANNPDYGYFWSSTSAYFSLAEDTTHSIAWYVAFGTAVDGDGEDLHGAGAVREDYKTEDSPTVPSEPERIYNYVRCVRDTGMGVEESENAGNFPLLTVTGGNPFSGSAALDFELTSAGSVDLSIYDVSGRKVTTLLSQEMPAGSGSVVWDASQVSSGVYLCVMNTGGISVSTHLVLVR